MIRPIQKFYLKVVFLSGLGFASLLLLVDILMGAENLLKDERCLLAGVLCGESVDDGWCVCDGNNSEHGVDLRCYVFVWMWSMSVLCMWYSGDFGCVHTQAYMRLEIV